MRGCSVGLPVGNCVSMVLSHSSEAGCWIFACTPSLSSICCSEPVISRGGIVTPCSVGATIARGPPRQASRCDSACRSCSCGGSSSCPSCSSPITTTSRRTRHERPHRLQRRYLDGRLTPREGEVCVLACLRRACGVLAACLRRACGVLACLRACLRPPGPHWPPGVPPPPMGAILILRPLCAALFSTVFGPFFA